MTASLGAADLDNNTVTVTASRATAAQPDQVQIFVELTAPQDVGLDDILGKLKGTGILAGDLTNVGGSLTVLLPELPSMLRWNFAVTVPMSALKTTLATLTQLKAALNSPVALSFSVTGIQSSPDVQSCPLPALVSDARRQADTMASAAGMRVGAVVSVSNDVQPVPSIPAVIFTGAIGLRLGYFTSDVSSPTCSLTIQFKLL